MPAQKLEEEIVLDRNNIPGSAVLRVRRRKVLDFEDGVRDVVLVYSHQRQETRPEGLPVLVIMLKDAYYPFEVDLHYKVVSPCDLIQRAHQAQDG